MKICQKCGAQVEDGIDICPECGTPLELQSTEPAAQEDTMNSQPTAEEYPLNEAPKWTSEQIQQPESTQTISAEGTSVPQWTLDQQQTPAVPVKKSGKGKKIIIIAACAVLVLGISGFIGKTFFARDLMKLFMGQNKYAQSLEESTAYALTDKTMQTLDSVMQSIPVQKDNQAADFEGSLHVDLDSKFSSQLAQQMGGNDAVLKNLLAYINALSFKGNTNVNNQAMQSTFQITHQSNKLLSCNMFMDKTGKYYYQLPDISKTYLTAENSQNPYNLAVKYDSAKLNSSLRALAKVYVDAVPNAKTSVQDGQSLSIEGLTVTAEKISIAFTPEQCKQILTKMLQTIKNDDYLYTVISDNYSALSKGAEKMDKTQYQNGLDGAIRELNSRDDSSSDGVLTVSSYVMPDGTQVAHSYEISGMKGDISKGSLNFIFTQKNGLSQIALNVLGDGKEYVTGTLLYNTANSGTMQISVKDPSQNMNVGLKVEFSDITKTKFANKDISTGTYKFSISDPDNFLGKAITESAGAQNDLIKDITKSTFTLKSKVENNKLTSTVTANITGIVTVTFNSASASKASSAVTLPAVNEKEAIVIDSAGSPKEGQEKLMVSYTADAMKYLSSLMDKDTELAALLKMFGLDKNTLDTYANAYSQSY